MVVDNFPIRVSCQFGTLVVLSHTGICVIVLPCTKGGGGEEEGEVHCGANKSWIFSGQLAFL